MEANRFSMYHNKALTQWSSTSPYLSASKNYFQLILVLFLHLRSIRWPRRRMPKSVALSLAQGAALALALAQGVSAGVEPPRQCSAGKCAVSGLHPGGETHNPLAHGEKQQLDEYVDRSSCSPVSGMLGSAIQITVG